jgi:hypothetical protein
LHAIIIENGIKQNVEKSIHGQIYFKKSSGLSLQLFSKDPTSRMFQNRCMFFTTKRKIITAITKPDLFNVHKILALNGMNTDKNLSMVTVTRTQTVKSRDK